MCSRKASPTSRFLPVTLICMVVANIPASPGSLHMGAFAWHVNWPVDPARKLSSASRYGSGAAASHPGIRRSGRNLVDGLLSSQRPWRGLTLRSRRRWTEEGIPNSSRYLATVRRAISMCSSRNRWTIVSSERTASPSWPIKSLMRWRTASAECASPSEFGGGDCCGEEVLELEDAAGRCHVLV